jgi:hypothetical protein
MISKGSITCINIRFWSLWVSLRGQEQAFLFGECLCCILMCGVFANMGKGFLPDTPKDRHAWYKRWHDKGVWDALAESTKKYAPIVHIAVCVHPPHLLALTKRHDLYIIAGMTEWIRPFALQR